MDSRSDVLLRGGRVMDPASGIDRKADVLLRDGKIAEIGRDLRALRAEEEYDCRHLLVLPGLIDMHVHLREPGMEAEETIASGAAAAIHGGFTSVACMPNTDPPLDTQAGAEFVYLQAERTGLARVYPVGAATQGLGGQALSEMGMLVRGGAVAFSDDGNPIQNTGLARRVLHYASMFDRPVISHCEDKDLSGRGVMNAGSVALTLGLAGMPRLAEELHVHRDIVLAESLGARLHIAHVSTAGSVDLIRSAKARGARVTAEATPHHLLLTDDAVRSFDPNLKMNPPLRTESDVRAVLRGLREGTLDAIVSDHAPHAPEEKEVEFDAAPFGVIGLETTLGIVLTHVVGRGKLSLAQAVERLTAGPARILGLPAGTLAPGAPADVTVVDPNAEWVVDPSDFRSKSRNCPFAGWKLKGRAIHVFVGGRRVN